MNLGIQKFNKEIFALNSLKREQTLHPVLKEQIKRRVLGFIANQPEQSAIFSSKTLRIKILQYLAPIIAGLLLCAGTVFASSGSLPGDVLYPVKLAKENIELKLARTAKARAEIKATQATNRLIELDKLTAKNPRAAVSVKTESTAKAEVDDALKNLTVLQNQLSADGDSKGAQDVSNRILNLKTKAGENKILDKLLNNGQKNNSNKIFNNQSIINNSNENQRDLRIFKRNNQ